MKSIPLFICLSLATMIVNAQDIPMEKGFLYIAHRGACYLAPENTLASIQLAWDLGADGVECDVMLTSDRRVVLFHDKTTKKLTGENYTIKETNWEQLQQLSVKPRETNLSNYEGEPIPLLENVLGTIPDDRMLVIEIKTGPEILPYLKPVIDQHWKSGSISFIAFDFETIKAVKKLYPTVPCFYLSSLKPELKKRLNEIVENNLDGVDLRHSIIDNPLMEQCDDLGLDVWCWTVNDPETAKKMKKMGVTAVTTDRPAWLKKNLFSL